MYEWSDFSFLSEFQVPISVSVYYNETNLNETIIENHLDMLYKRMNEYFIGINTTMKDFEIKRNIGYMFYQNGFGNISGYQKEFLTYYLNQFNDIPLVRKPNALFYPFSSEKYVLDYELQSQYYYNQSTSFMTINEMYCYEKFSDEYNVCSNEVDRNAEIVYESVIWATVIIGFLFYLALLTVCKTKSVKRRLTAPYALPILIIGFNISITSYTLSCRSVNYVVSICCLSAVVGIYGFSLIRFSYLRYLYLFLSKAKSETTIKIHKFLVSSWFGIIGSFMSGFIYACIWMIICIPYIVDQKQYSLQAELNIMYAVQILLGTILGSLIILIDIALNWKKIKDKGLLNFLSFEDPFGLRIDLFLVYHVNYYCDCNLCSIQI